MTEMPVRIIAWTHGHWEAAPVPGLIVGDGDDATPFVRADVAEELAAALEAARDFIRAEYESPRAQALEGEFLSADARPVWNIICAVISRYRSTK